MVRNQRISGLARGFDVLNNSGTETSHMTHLQQRKVVFK